MSVEKLRGMVLASLLAALTAAGSYIQIPIGPVPIVLTNLFVLLSGLLLGSRWGVASVGVYLLVGAMGMPVFAGGKGGLAHFLGPTGGYLLGYALSVWGVGLIAERSKGKYGLGNHRNDPWGDLHLCGGSPLAQDGDADVVDAVTDDRGDSLLGGRCAEGLGGFDPCSCGSTYSESPAPISCLMIGNAIAV